MTNIIFLYGTIAGLVVISVLVASIAAGGGHADASSNALLFGYLTMIVALTLIFFGVKRYRDRDLGGVIKFVPALLMGLAIAAVAGVIYVAVWEVYSAATNNAYFDGYMTAYINGEKAKGLSGTKLEELIAKMNAIKVRYNTDPLYRMAVTFSEIFPVGAIIALISAALLRVPKFLPARA